MCFSGWRGPNRNALLPFAERNRFFPLLIFKVSLLQMLWIDEILHQLVGGLSHYLQDSSIPTGAGFRPSTVCSHFFQGTKMQMEAYPPVRTFLRGVLQFSPHGLDDRATGTSKG